MSDDKGQEVSSASEYLVIKMPVTFDSQKNAAIACPFYYNLETLHNTWLEDYPVTINGLEVICDGEVAELSGSYDIIHNRLSPDTDVFNKCGFYSGTYLNPLTKQTEKLTLHYVAYEPKHLKSALNLLTTEKSSFSHLLSSAWFYQCINLKMYTSNLST